MSYLPGVLKLLAVIQFSENKKNVTYQTIQDYLNENSINLGDSIELYFYKFAKNLMVQSLHLDKCSKLQLKDLILTKKIQRRNQSPQEYIQEIFFYYQGVPDKGIKEILKFWHNEKHSIYDMIQRKGTQYNEIDELKWSLNIKTYGKNTKNMRDPSLIMNIKLQTNKYDGPKNIVFELDKQELEEFCDELDTIEQAIDKILTRDSQAESSQ